MAWLAELGDRMVPMHGGATGDSNYGLNPELQKFIDSELGQTISLLSHTIGIFVFMFGVGYVAFRVWRPGAHRAFTRRDVEVSRGVVWGGLMLNGLGGAMRLAMSDHPTLAQIGSNVWVQLIFAKHMLWFLLVGASYLLLNRGLPQLIASGEHLVDPQMATRAKKTIANSVGLVVLIAIMGGAASVIGPSGMAGMTPDSAMQGQVLVPMNHTNIAYFNATTATGVMGQPYRAENTLQVPVNSTRLELVLNWTSANALFQLQVLDPRGTSAGPAQTQGMRVTLNVENPSSGNWKIIVTSTQAVQEGYTVKATVRYVAMEPANAMNHTMSPAPAQGAERLDSTGTGPAQTGFTSVDDAADRRLR